MENLCKGCEIAKIYCVKLSKCNVSFSVSKLANLHFALV